MVPLRVQQSREITIESAAVGARCFDAPLAAAVSTACGGTECLLATPEVDHAVVEAVRTELARLALVGKVGKVGKETATLPGTHLVFTPLDRIAPGARS